MWGKKLNSFKTATHFAIILEHKMKWVIVILFRPSQLEHWIGDRLILCFHTESFDIYIYGILLAGISVVPLVAKAYLKASCP